MKLLKGRLYKIQVRNTRAANQFLEALQRSAIEIYKLQSKDEMLEFYIAQKSFSTVKKLRRKYRVKLKVQDEEHGHLFLRDHFTLLGLVFFLCIPIILNSFLWDVEIHSATPETEDAVAEIIKKDLKIYQGKSMKQLPSEAHIRQTILATHPELSWVFISKIGSKMQVEVQYAPVVESVEEDTAKGNLVARSSGVITHANVLSGERLVTENMTVYKGDLLVSGIIRYDNVDHIVGAKGEVFADYWLNTEFSIPVEIEMETVEDRAWKIYSFTLPKRFEGFKGLLSNVVKLEEVAKVKKTTFRLTEETAPQYVEAILQQKINTYI